VPDHLSPDDRRRVLERLRCQLARQALAPAISDGGPGFGLEAVDRVLPGGLARGGVHEFCGAGQATTGLGAVLLGRFARAGPVVWIRPQGDLYAPGLAGLGLLAERLIVVRVGPREDRLWALEEVLRSRVVAAGLAEIDRLSLTQGRRLQLAAEAGAATGMLLRPEAMLRQPAAASTRWRVALLATPPDRLARPDPGPPRWDLELVRCRTGGAGRWRIEWRDGGFHEVQDPFPLAAPPVDRPARARPG
jgi:protein ImuA